MHNLNLTFTFIFSTPNTSVCESLWDDCDDSLFSEMADIDKIEKTDLEKHTQTNSEISDSSSLPINAENNTKRKYNATESSEPKEQIQKNIIKKLKHNSLFK